MTIARRLLVPEGVSRCYHCVSRCVRRAFLCDDNGAHRKDWIKQRLLELDRVFAIEIGGFAIMGNHLHLLLRTQPEWAQVWSDEEVARRWLALYPRLGQRIREATGATDDQQVLRQILTDQARLRCWRQRLASLSWYMKCLKEPIARRANLEDGVTGHFWEGRFKIQSLLDAAAVLACLVYIDLNPIRAQVALTPEESAYTSVQDRIRIRQWNRELRLGARAARKPAELVASPKAGKPTNDEEGIWLIPIERQRTGSKRRGLVDLGLDQYLKLVDTTGRLARFGSRGRMPADLEPILCRLEVDPEKWMSELIGQGRRVGTAIGSAASLAVEAARRGAKWIVGALPVYREDPFN